MCRLASTEQQAWFSSDFQHVLLCSYTCLNVEPTCEAAFVTIDGCPQQGLDPAFQELEHNLGADTYTSALICCKPYTVRHTVTQSGMQHLLPTQVLNFRVSSVNVLNICNVIAEVGTLPGTDLLSITG